MAKKEFLMTDTQLDLTTLLEKNGVSNSTAYYAGRSATASDLDGDKLFGMYTMIKQQVGDKAASAFSRLVTVVRPLTAVRFIEAMRKFYNAGWVFDTDLLSPPPPGRLPIDDATTKEAFDGASFGMVQTMMHMHQGDDTNYIVYQFMNRLEEATG